MQESGSFTDGSARNRAGAVSANFRVRVQQNTHKERLVELKIEQHQVRSCDSSIGFSELKQEIIKHVPVRYELKQAELLSNGVQTWGFQAIPVDENSLVFSHVTACLLYTSPSPRDKRQSRMPSSA